MDPYRRANRYGRESSPRVDVTAPRRDPNNRISKPSRQDTPPRSNGPSRGARNNNTSLEDEQTRKWVSEEDQFVLKQAKKKAQIRVKEGRAKPIDWLAVILRVIDPNRDLLDDDEDEVQIDVVDPEGVFEGLDDGQLAELEGEIKSYLVLETNRANQEYWQTMQVICSDRRQKLSPHGSRGRVVGSVAADIDKLLSPKSYDQLQALEKQIRTKLRSNEDIDVDYWEQLLKSLLVWKAKAKLKSVYQSVIDSRLETLRKHQKEDADGIRAQLQNMLDGQMSEKKSSGQASNSEEGNISTPQQQHLVSSTLDPEPLLKLNPEDKALDVIDEVDFLKKTSAERLRVLKLGYVPSPAQSIGGSIARAPAKTPGSAIVGTHPPGTQRFSTAVNDDYSQATKALYEREVARGIDENEEIFTAEENVSGVAQPQWAEKYPPRKPKYFNRVQMGYEWNKYNQTHYDHDNPPPKVVQGYKFNIFYPDLVDKTKAPSFKIIREHGRRKGESFAPAGEEDTCLIKFIAGPPYQDIAFRIVDKEWDYSAKRDRGFKSSFDKGILSLHFQFKKIYYRK